MGHFYSAKIDYIFRLFAVPNLDLLGPLTSHVDDAWLEIFPDITIATGTDSLLLGYSRMSADNRNVCRRPLDILVNRSISFLPTF